MRSCVPLCRVGQFLHRLHLLQAGQWQRSVSTLSPLGSAFNAKPSPRINFSPMRKNVGLFCIKELDEHMGFYLLQENVKNRIDELVDEATSPNRKRKIVEIFDELSDSICRVADMADFVRIAHPDQNFMVEANEACITLTSLVERLNTNTSIHEALKAVLENDDIQPMDDVERRVSELFMFDFEQSGIHLDEATRQEFVKLNENIMMLSNFFMQGTQNTVAVSKDKLPQNIRHCFNVDGDNITVTGLFSDHYSDLVREAAYRIYLHPYEHQEKLLSDLLKARRQLAQLVGFSSYTERGLKGTLGETPENVMNFLTTLAKNIKESAEKDYDIMLKSKVKEGGQKRSGYTIANSLTGQLASVTHLLSSVLLCFQEIMPWDIPYYTAIGRHKMCKLNSQELAPYFSLGSCMEGLNKLFESLFDVTLEPAGTRFGELWSPEVIKLAVTHGEEGILGYIYCDFYERAEKLNQDCHFTIQGGRLRSDGLYQLPLVVLQLNLPSPQSSVPSLLTPGMMENLFHEFGHAMHSMLGRTRFQHVTGTRCPVDFAEVPSVLMEYFASDPRVISSFARHYQTGQPLSQEVVTSMCTSKKLYFASDLQLQVFYAILDQVYHGEEIPGKTTTEIMEEIQNKYYSLPYISGTAWQLRFGHLVGYGGKYYSYIMSRAIASRIWQECFKADPFNRENGEKYREKMLAHGGEKHPRELVQDMFNEAPTVDMLVNSLMQEVYNKTT